MFADKFKFAHGGPATAGKRKSRRPISLKRPMHLMLSSKRARGRWSLASHGREIRGLVRDTAAKQKVRVLHLTVLEQQVLLTVQVKKRSQLQNFLRVFPQRLMFLITGACKGNPQGPFWDNLALSWVGARVSSWSNYWRKIVHLKPPKIFDWVPSG